MSRLRLSVLLVLGGLAVLLVVILLRRERQAPHGREGRTSKEEMRPSGTEKSSPSTGTPSKGEAEVRGRLSADAAALRTRSGPEAARKILADLRAYLDGLPKAVAVTAVIDFLNEGADVPTGLEFSVAPGGILTGATSLRVFLLDYLATADPLAAGQYGERILQTATSPDEWAIAMRNCARADSSPERTAFLQRKAEEMIQNGAWLKNPSSGFLEAFDVFVQTQDTAAIPLLGKLVQNKDQGATSYAAYLTLDRLAIAQPQAVFEQMEQQPELFKGRELMQSNFLARADVRDAEQRAQVERYLLNENRTPAELAAFASVYPNNNYMISNNLLTATQTPSQAEIITRDQAALQVTNEWLADPRFERIRPQLQTIQRRLQSIVPPAR